MATTLCYNSLNPSTTVFSRTHFSVTLNKELPLDASPFVVGYNCGVGCRTRKQRKKVMHVKCAVVEAPPGVSPSAKDGNGTTPSKKQLRILVAGGGIGGLVFALAAKRKGLDFYILQCVLILLRTAYDTFVRP